MRPPERDGAREARADAGARPGGWPAVVLLLLLAPAALAAGLACPERDGLTRLAVLVGQGPLAAGVPLPVPRHLRWWGALVPLAAGGLLLRALVLRRIPLAASAYLAVLWIACGPAIPAWRTRAI